MGCCCSVAKVVSDSLDCSTLGFPCPSLSPRACSNSCPLIQWWHPTISFSVTPFSSWPQSFPASRSFPVSWFFASGGQSIGASASTWVNTQGWFPLGLTGLISLPSRSSQESSPSHPCLWSTSCIHTVLWMGRQADFNSISFHLCSSSSACKNKSPSSGKLKKKKPLN